MSAFRIGQKVVCVNISRGFVILGSGKELDDANLTLGATYTIRRTRGSVVWLEEIAHRLPPPGCEDFIGLDEGFGQKRFRPLVESEAGELVSATASG